MSTDTITGTNSVDTIFGGTVNDTIMNTLGGNDMIYVGSSGYETGYDWSYPLYSADYTGNSIVNAGDGDDFVSSQGNGQNVWSGGNGNDMLFAYRFWSEDGVVKGLNTLSGGNGDDNIFAQGAKNVLNGDAGSDTLGSGGADSTLNGGAGDDYIYAYDTSSSVLNGGAGNDSLIANGSANIALNGGVGNDNLCYYSWGTPQNRSDAIKLNGSEGNDTLSGGISLGLVIENGGNGDDTLIANGSNVLMFGSNGSDNFQFQSSTSNNNVIVKDYNPGQGDTITIDDQQGMLNINGELPSDKFVANATGTPTTDQQIVFNTTTGELYYIETNNYQWSDDDGNITTEVLTNKIVYATLVGIHSLDVSDITVIGASYFGA